MTPSWPLPENDPWSTPFAELLMHHLELQPGDTVLDIAAGGGIPAFIWQNRWDPEVRFWLWTFIRRKCFDPGRFKARTCPGCSLKSEICAFYLKRFPLLIALLETFLSCFFARIVLKLSRTWFDS